MFPDDGWQLASCCHVVGMCPAAEKLQRTCHVTPVQFALLHMIVCHPLTHVSSSRLAEDVPLCQGLHIDTSLPHCGIVHVAGRPALHATASLLLSCSLRSGQTIAVAGQAAGYSVQATSRDEVQVHAHMLEHFPHFVL